MTSLGFDSYIAPYGPNVASYAIKIVEADSLSTIVIYENIPSGIKMGSTLSFMLLDYDNQKFPDNSNSIKVNAQTQRASVSGFNSAKVDQGVAEFNNLIFTFIQVELNSYIQYFTKLIHRFWLDLKTFLE